MEKDNIRINRLKEIMRKREMTARELSIKANISEASISRYLSGKLSPKLDSIQALAKALDVDPVWLLGYDPVVPEKETLPIGSFHGGLSTRPDFWIEFDKLSDKNKEQALSYIKYLIEMQKGDKDDNS